MNKSTLTTSSSSNDAKTPVVQIKTEPQSPDFLKATLKWYKFGFQVIPIVPHTKKTAVKWDPWLEPLSILRIYRHWRNNPDHELGFIVGQEIIVFDADTPESLRRLYQIEFQFGIKSKLIVKTCKGEHHYFRLANGTFAKSDSHSSEKHPERIDVKTGRALIVLPPSGGKEVLDND